MNNLSKIKKNLYIYNVCDPSVFKLDLPKDDQLNGIVAYLEEHYNVVSNKGNVKMTLQTIGILGISKILTKNVTKAAELLMKQLKLAEEKKIEVEIVKAVNNLGVIFHMNGDLLRSYVAFGYAAKIRFEHQIEFISEIYNLANIQEQLGKIDSALQLYIYCYRWYSCRVPLNEFRVVKILLSILDIYTLKNQLEECIDVIDKIRDHIRHLIEIKDSHPLVLETIFEESKIVETTEEKSLEKGNVFGFLKNFLKRK